jgi:predicted nucleotidyltransferase
MQRTIAFSEEHKQLLKRIKSTILAIEPDAEVYLYGSRARGDAEEDSDWDMLILVSGTVTAERKHQIWDALYDIEIATLTIVSATVKSRQEWQGNSILQATPFYRTVSQDALSL